MNAPLIRDISKGDGPLVHIVNEDQVPLPPPFDKLEDEPRIPPLSDQVKQRFECNLDDTIVVNIPKAKSPAEEEELVNKFLSGLRKSFTKENNWTFLMPLVMSMEHCARCQTCNDACHIYCESGKNPLHQRT